MATFAELQRERRAAVAEVRRRQRAADTAIERLERRLLKLRDRKTLIDAEAVMTLNPLWRDFIRKVNSTEVGIIDLMNIVKF